MFATIYESNGSLQSGFSSSNKDELSDDESLRQWAEQRRLYAEVIAGGGERVSSIGKWAAFDTQAKGVVSEGVYTCVTIAKEQTPNHPGFVAHISPDKQPLIKTGRGSVLDFILSELLPKGITDVAVYGMNEQLLHEVIQLLRQAGIATQVTINKNKNASFTVVVKGTQMQAWLQSNDTEY